MHSSDDEEEEDVSLLANPGPSVARHAPVELAEGAFLLSRCALTPNISVAGHKPLAHKFVVEKRTLAQPLNQRKESSSAGAGNLNGSVAQTTCEHPDQGDSFTGFSNMSSLISGALGALQADVNPQECFKSNTTNKNTAPPLKRSAEEPPPQPLKRHTSLFSMVTKNR